MVFLLPKFNKFESNWRNYLNDYLKLDMNSFNWCQPAVIRPATGSRDGKTWNLRPVPGLGKRERSTLRQADSWRYLKHLRHISSLFSLAGFQTLKVSKREKLDLPDQFPLTSFPFSNFFPFSVLAFFFFSFSIFAFCIFPWQPIWKGSISVSGQLPTYPSPNPTTVSWQQFRVNVGLGEG